jgi:hypothetical protein
MVSAEVTARATALAHVRVADGVLQPEVLSYELPRSVSAHATPY